MTIHPMAATPRVDNAAPAKEGLFGRMVRLWIEHNRRMVEFGIRPY